MSEEQVNENSDVAEYRKSEEVSCFAPREGEEELRKEEERWRAYVEDAADLIFTTDKTGKIASVNRTVCETLGYVAEELLGKNVLDLVQSEERRALAETMLRKMLSGETVHPIELEVLSRDGGSITLEVRGRALYDGSRIVGTLQIARDISERKHMMEELGKLSQFRESIIDNANVWLDVLDEKANVVIWNKAAEAISGYSREEVIGHDKIWEWLYPDEEYRRSITDTVAEVIQRGRVDEGFETRIRRKDGQTRIISWNERNLLGEHGKVVGSIAIGRDITERKRAEEALRESEEKYRRLFEQAMDGIALADAETGIMLDCNQALAALVGRNRKELIGQHQTILHPPAGDGSAFSPTFRLHLTTREGQVLETQVITSTGEIREAEIKANMLYLQGRRTLQGIFHDITERKRAEDALRRRAEELAELQATVLDITSQRDLPALLHAIVERAAKLLGATSGGMYVCNPEKKEVRCVVSYNTPYDYRGVVLKYGEGAAGRVAETGRPLIVNDYPLWEGRAAVYEKDRPFSAVLTAPMMWQGQVTGVIHVMEESKARRFTQDDLELLMLFANQAAIAVERTRMEEELRRHSEHLEELVDDKTWKLRQTERDLRSTKERLEYVLASNPAAIYSGKPLADGSDFHLTYLSEAVVTILGFEPQEFIGHPEFWDNHIHPEDRRSVLAEVPVLWKEGQHTFEYRVRHKDGTYRWIREEATVVRDADGKPVEVNGYWTDVSERKRLEEELLRSRRLAAIGETAAMVGHDLRNPLQGIASAAYYLRTNERSKLSKRGKEMLALIGRDVRGSDKIITDLLEYSREIRLELIRTDVRSIIKEALESVKIPKTIRLVDSTKTQPKIMMDVHQMRRVFVNIMRNAVDAMPNGGTLRIASAKSGDNIQVIFRDTGEGMRQETLSKIWTPLFTTKSSGMGFGLAIVKRIVEAHRGSVAVESKRGEGSTFTLTLPINANRDNRQ
jgi:PAS domain S-box-containing protein